MYIKRDNEALIRKISDQSQILLVNGPRLVGKSTLLNHIDPDRLTVSLDMLTIREQALFNPKGYLQRSPGPLLIKSIENAPELLPAIKSIADEEQEGGCLWLTANQQFRRLDNSSRSLGCRILVLRLLGLSQRELNGWLGEGPFLPTEDYLKNCRRRRTLESEEIFHFIWKGSHPKIWKGDVDWEYFYNSYFQELLERDVCRFTKITSDLDLFRFARIVAQSIGQPINHSALAAKAGISQPKAKAWLSVLEDFGLIYLLPAYCSTRHKRVIKSSKLYFTDTGLAAFLSGWLIEQAIEPGIMGEAFLENFAVIEILKSYRNAGLEPSLFYYPDTDGREIDLIIEEHGKLFPVGIKNTDKPRAAMIKNFEVLPRDLRGRGSLLCLVKEETPLSSEVSAIPFFYL